MVQVLVVNAGNTHTQMAMLHSGGLDVLERYETSDLLAGLEPDVFATNRQLPIAAATVVPELRDVWAARNVTWISAKQRLNVDFSLVNTDTLGADRVANAVAAVALVGPPAIVVDCGTAITFEVLDEASRFLGGAILPGRKLARMALNCGTAQLPDVPLSSEFPNVLGTDTPGAITSGVDCGAVGAVQRLLDEYRQSVGRDAAAIAVGGDCDYFGKYVVGLEPGSPEFTLKGVAIAAGLMYH